MKTTFIRSAVALLAVCTILFTAVAQPLTAQDAKKPQESSRLEKLLAGEAPGNLDDLKAMQNRFRELAAKLIPCTCLLYTSDAADE